MIPLTCLKFLTFIMFPPFKTISQKVYPPLSNIYPWTIHPPTTSPLRFTKLVVILVVIFNIRHYFSNISFTLYLLQILSRNHPIRNYWHKSSFKHQCKSENHHTKVKILILASEHVYKLFCYRDPLRLLFTFLCQMTLIHVTLCPPLFSLIRTSYAITDLSFF